MRGSEARLRGGSLIVSVLEQLRTSGRTRLNVHRSHGTSPSGPRPTPVAMRQERAGLRTDDGFVTSGIRDAERLVDLAGLTHDSRLLDLGCGPGRLTIGLHDLLPGLPRYVDVQLGDVTWCHKHLAALGWTFVHVDARNDRYNPSGAERLPLDIAPGFDVAFAYSVFSHMRADDVSFYLAELGRLLDPGGVAAFTAFVEHGVDSETVNPPSYGPHVLNGALHIVRDERRYFETMITAAGFTVETLDYATDNQQSMYACRRT
jgi:SAM-dependent methyltransferase